MSKCYKKAIRLSNFRVNTCTRQEGCVTLRLWKMLDDAISDVVDKVTLADMEGWQNEMLDNYVI